MDAIKTVTIVAVIGSVLLYGCNGKGNPLDEYEGGEGNGRISDTWVMTQMTFEMGTGTYTVMASDSQQLTLTLNSNLTYHQEQISISSGVNVKTVEDGTYSVSGSSLNQISSTGLQTSGNFSLGDDTMVLTCIKISQGQTYTTVYHFRRR